MVKRKKIAENIEEVKEAMEKTGNKTEYRKLQCIYLGDTKSELSAGQIGEITQYSEGSVKRIHAEYRKRGMESVKDTRGGRRRENLTIEQERELLREFEETSSLGQVSEISRIKAEYEKTAGKKVDKTVIYRMLHRHGFRKIVPYQRHKKGDSAKQEEFKKTSSVQ
jgi:transposase